MDSESLRGLALELVRLRESLLAEEARREPTYIHRSPQSLPSLRNFAHYLALRRHDLRGLQERLSEAGLSSLGRSERDVLWSIDAILGMLSGWGGVSPETLPPSRGTVSRLESVARIRENAQRVLGPEPKGRATRIMMTVDGERASDPAFFEEAILGGANLMRINGAHDDIGVWIRAVESIEVARRRTGCPCRIQFDLAGPKLRTVVHRPVDVAAGTRLRLLPPEAIDAMGGRGSFGDVGCSLKDLWEALRPGDPIFFDDGKIRARVMQRTPEAVEVQVERTKPGGATLKNDRGINAPNTRVAIEGFTEKDVHDLVFAREYADIIALSFVQSEEDIARIEGALPPGKDRALMLKIENRRGFESLPRLLEAAVGRIPVAVMIARGDLAVEVGYERLAEVQEEILWLCEAAHVPVVWATQVLERLAKKGLPTRSEITDAAMAERAECVMLNKGPHILEAVRVLDDILRRMGTHQRKKFPLLRPLRVATSMEESRNRTVLKETGAPSSEG